MAEYTPWKAGADMPGAPPDPTTDAFANQVKKIKKRVMGTAENYAEAQQMVVEFYVPDTSYPLGAVSQALSEMKREFGKAPTHGMPLPEPPAMSAKDFGECADCKFWQRANSGAMPNESGWCSRYPPRANEIGVGTWPTTYEGDWCGEFKASK